MQASTPLLRQRKIEPAEGLNAKLGSIVLCEELGDRALCAIKRDRAVCADDIAPFIAWRAEWGSRRHIDLHNQPFENPARRNPATT